MLLSLDRLLLEAGPLERGVFMLFKCEFIEEGRNAPRGGRCENQSYGSLSPALGTSYANQTWDIAHNSDFDNFEVKLQSMEKWEHIISVVPHFFIDYAQFKQVSKDSNLSPGDLQTNFTPSAMWVGRSIYQLFKTMREWSFMLEEPFNSDHPMAIYSKMAIDTLEIPQAIMAEIDAMPDMHLAKFLKGQEDYKLIPAHPAISQEFKQWIVAMAEKYPTLTYEEKLAAAAMAGNLS